MGPDVPLTSRAPGDVLFRVGGEAITASRFLAAAHRVAQALPDAAHVVNLCQDRLHFAVGIAAAVLRGQVSLLTSDRSAARLEHLARILPGCCSIAEAGETSGPLPHPGPLPHHRVTLDFADAGGMPDNPAIPADRPAALVFTSGSTGEPTGHLKRWGALATRSIAAADRFGFAVDTAILGMVPPQHMYGFETTVLLPLHAPVTVGCDPAFYPADVEQALGLLPAPRVLVTTPLQLRALLAAERRIPPLAGVISATAPLYRDLAEAVERAWGAPVSEIYGATEVGSIASRRTIEAEEWQVYPSVRLEVEADGAVQVHAPWAEPTPLNDAIAVEAEGRFRLLGRRSDLIKLAGKRASLAGLNRILNAIEGVQDGLFVAPEDLDERPSARLLAYVVAPGRSGEEILAVLRERVDPVFLPRRVVRVDALPRNEAGKLPRHAVAALPDPET